MARGLRLAASVVVLAVVVSGAGGRATAGVRHAAVAPVPQASVVIPGKLIVGFRRGVSARDRKHALDAAGAGTGTSLGSNRVQLATVAPRASARAMSLLEGNADVSYVDQYKPTMYGFNAYRKGVRPADLRPLRVETRLGDPSKPLP